METAHKTEAEKQEFFDPPDVLDKKVDKFVEMLKASKHFIAFTGAGISTSAGIPDFRSGVNTVLPTGPGCWEKLANKQKVNRKVIKTNMLQAIPTKCHMALVELERKGFLKFLVSQNIDGLHRRSGFDIEKLAELHGNTNLEICKKCNKKYMRDFRCRTAQKVLDHITMRKCDNPACRGDLYDSIINFGESLPEKELNDSFAHAKKADLCLAMGSSLRVTPAANIPETVGERKNDLVIVNLQKTPIDGVASLRVNALCDVFIEMVMKKMDLQIPEFILTRRLGVTRTIINKKDGILFRGIDKDNCPYSVYKSIAVDFHKKVTTMEKEPYFYSNDSLNFTKNEVLTVILEFQGNYGEPNYKHEILLQSLKEQIEQKYILEYNPRLGKWINCLEIN